MVAKGSVREVSPPDDTVFFFNFRIYLLNFGTSSV